jgi:cytochrome c556
MKYRCIIGSVCLVIGSSTLSGVAFDHGKEIHGNTASADAQMKKLHVMMPMFSLASAGMETALKKSEITVVEAEAEKIIAAIPELKKSKPNKNIKQRQEFVELATNLEKTVTSTLYLAKKGDFAGATAAFRKVEKACATCHAKFRD